MTEQIRENYFLAVKMLLMLVSEIYLLVIQFGQAGASGEMLLFLALFLGFFVGEGLLKNKWRLLFLMVLAAELFFLINLYGKSFLLLGILLAYEFVSYMKFRFHGASSVMWYFFPVLIAWIPTQNDMFAQVAVALLAGIIYVQHDFIVTSYRKEIKENSLSEQHLKKSMNRQEHALREELNRGLLVAENQMLEEKTRLSQTLHDKLGHNINGSIYQLEAVKVLLEKDPETSKNMVQAVIDQLRTGMDEIRSILRRERPEKYKLAILQLQRLCEECESMGINAELVTKGDLSEVSEKYLEIVLDNACEAVSNALKYAHCTKIEITIVVMNKILRCTISDNGVGCGELVDGMGIAGMRRRMRSANGILDFNTEAGFSINMLLPMKE